MLATARTLRIVCTVLYWVKLIQEEEAICRTSPLGFRLAKQTLLVAVMVAIPVCALGVENFPW
jgi:hypothetical protein